MHILDFVITNYKSFKEGPHTPLTPGFNVIVGRNNVGKSAIVEALSTRFTSAPHRSLETQPTATVPLDDQSTLRFLVEFSSSEFREIATKIGPNWFIPRDTDAKTPKSNATELFFQFWDNDSPKQMSVEFTNGVLTESLIWGLGGVASSASPLFAYKIAEEDRDIPSEYHRNLLEELPWNLSLPSRFAWEIRERIYAFRAERLNVGESAFAYDRVLLPDASNLARVLNHVQSNPIRFKRLNDLIRAIFPDITQISVVPTEQQNLRILIWTVDPTTERDDLAIPLAQSGTGIGQVLAILSVVITSEFPRVIVIDEPQSFLHPGAVKKLFEILKFESLHPHQYVVTTHSPVAIATTDPDLILLIRKDGPESKVEFINPQTKDSLRLYLAEIGASLGDVFGADSILWVEGSTEENCYPLIVRRISKKALNGTSILGVRTTGDLEGRQAKVTLEIYQKLSTGSGLLPPAIGFLFDRETRTDREIQDLRRRSQGKVHFLTRRLFENYLLNASAIHYVISQAEGLGFASWEPITLESIESWLKSNMWNPRYFGGSTVSPEMRSDKYWLSEVHGAKLLIDLFAQQTDNKLPYEKVAHGILLTEWLMEHEPTDLTELADLIVSIIYAV